MNIKSGKYKGKYSKYKESYVAYRKNNINAIKEMWKEYKIKHKKERAEWIKNNKQTFLNYRKENNYKRRKLGYFPLNEYFDGSVCHHIDKERVVYIPKEMHISIKHNVFSGWNIDKINKLAFEFLESK